MSSYVLAYAESLDMSILAALLQPAISMISHMRVYQMKGTRRTQTLSSGSSE